MITRKEFEDLLANRSVLIIDGALATELENRGHDLTHPLWSAKTLREDPDAIQQVHLDYYLAGADVAITASYQASVEGINEHFGLSKNDAMSLIGKSVELAQNARDEAYKQIGHDRRLLVAGSIGPYGAYLADGSEYRGDYKRSSDELQDFHRPRIQALVKAGVDILVIETIPQLQEIRCVLALLRAEFSDALCWVSCTLQDPNHLSDGSSIGQFIEVVGLPQHQERVVAVGVNCVPAHMVGSALRTFTLHTQLPLLCYPNSGETYDAQSNTWSGTAYDEGKVGDQVRIWRERGAKMIGGCCRTGPEYIRLVSKALRDD